jgi:hypothetical protein
MRAWRGFWTALLLSGCTTSGNIDTGEVLEARFVRPPQSDVFVGSLYYAREEPTTSLTKPISIEQLCYIDYSAYAIKADTKTVADIDLLRTANVSASLSGIQTKLVALGLSGDLSRYFELKAVNVKKVSLWNDDIESLMDKLAASGKCQNWRKNIKKYGWAAYQIESIYVGDIVYSRKVNREAAADISAKLDIVEPSLKSTLKAESNTGLAGKALVFGVVPLPRS